MLIRVLKKYFLPFLAVYVLTMLFYWAVSLNLGNTPFLLQARRFVPAALASCLPFFLLPGLGLRQAWHTVLVAASYVVTAPLLAYISLSKTETLISNHMDLAFGLYLLPALLFGHYLLARLGPKRIADGVVSVVELLLLLPIVFQVCYFYRFQHCITGNGMMILYQTDLAEATEYIQSMGAAPIVAPLVLLAFWGWGLFKLNARLGGLFATLGLARAKTVFIALLALAVTGYAFGSAARFTYFNKLVLDTRSYFQQLAAFKTQRQAVLDQLQVVQHSQDRGTIILVIGESASRDYMSAFTAMAENTTPWLQSQKAKENFLLFSNAYACANYTVAALEHALTDADYYNGTAFNKAVSLLDIAQRAGYKTYWFSNQGLIKTSDTPITLVGKTAAVSRWLADDPQRQEGAALQRHYDELLLDYLKLVDPREKNLVIFHLMGSHIDYNNRYPSAFQKWTDPGETGRAADYKNSLLYTDSVLERLFQQAQKNLPLSIFVYCSDHGSDPNRRRNPDAGGYVYFRIPLVVYLSDGYIRQNPQEYATLRAHQAAFWSNDLFYDLLCGLMKIESNHVTPDKSLTSAAYRYRKEDIKVGLGRKRAANDPHLKK